MKGLDDILPSKKSMKKKRNISVVAAVAEANPIAAVNPEEENEENENEIEEDEDEHENEAEETKMKMKMKTKRRKGR
jgi:ribosomal protein L12E/L44/L45/RPP1/RPP2